MKTSLYIEREDGTLLCSKAVCPTIEVGKALDDGTPGPIVMLVSNEAVDSDGDIIHQRRSSKGPGWVLDRFKRAPVMTWQHDLRIPNISGPGTRPVVRKHDTKGQALFLDPVQFDEGDPFAMELEGKVRRGVLKESSVGFHILNREPRTDDDGNRAGLHIYGAELIEVALANRGANPDVDVLAKRMLGYADVAKAVQGGDDSEVAELKAEVQHLSEKLRVLENALKVQAEDNDRMRLDIDKEQAARNVAAKDLLVRLQKLGTAHRGS